MYQTARRSSKRLKVYVESLFRKMIFKDIFQLDNQLIKLSVKFFFVLGFIKT